MMYKYAKLKCGYASGFEVSPYQIACKALELDGKPMPSGTTYKKWVSKNQSFIASEIAKAGHQEPCKNTTSKSTGRKHKRPTEQSVIAFVSSSRINPASDEFLSSFEWRSTRMMALKRYGTICQCCGASPKTGATINVDHIKPRKLFPALALDIENLQVLCHECNHGKGNWDQTDWR